MKVGFEPRNSLTTNQLLSHKVTRAHSKIIKYLLCISEENLMKQLQNITINVEECRKRLNNLTNKNITLKHEDENIGREIRGIYLHTSIHIFLIEYHYLFVIKYVN